METIFCIYLAGTVTGFGLATMTYGLFKLGKKSDKEVKDGQNTDRGIRI